MKTKEKVDRVLRYGEDLIYLIIALFLIVAALVLLVSSTVHFIRELQQNDSVTSALFVIDKILLVMMILEILYTVRISFKSHVLCADPFLIVGLIAAIRRILLISIESAYDFDKFNHHMIEMGILGLIVLIFSWAIILLRKYPGSTV